MGIVYVVWNSGIGDHSRGIKHTEFKTGHHEAFYGTINFAFVDETELNGAVEICKGSATVEITARFHGGGGGGFGRISELVSTPNICDGIHIGNNVALKSP